MMNTRFFTIIIALSMLLILAACSTNSKPDELAESTSLTASESEMNSESDSLPVDNTDLPSTGQIFLFGEVHGVDKIYDKEFELWNYYYHNEGMRHLFIELPYYTAEFLNIWMQEDIDDILNDIYNDLADTMSHTPSIKEFYIKIKRECPGTVFHGTDVGHMYHTTGARYLRHLEENNLKDSLEYSLTEEVIEQGKIYNANKDHVYRENKMTENFIREFDSLKGENVMGIYGAAHTGIDAMDFMTNSVPCMANQLQEYYVEVIYSEDLSWIAKDISLSQWKP